jgi:hypothetical protein
VKARQVKGKRAEVRLVRGKQGKRTVLKVKQVEVDVEQRVETAQKRIRPVKRAETVQRKRTLGALMSLGSS